MQVNIQGQQSLNCLHVQRSYWKLTTKYYWNAIEILNWLNLFSYNIFWLEENFIDPLLLNFNSRPHTLGTFLPYCYELLYYYEMLTEVLVCVFVCARRGDRYDALRACIGQSFCLELHKLRVFMVSKLLCNPLPSLVQKVTSGHVEQHWLWLFFSAGWLRRYRLRDAEEFCAARGGLDQMLRRGRVKGRSMK